MNTLFFLFCPLPLPFHFTPFPSSLFLSLSSLPPRPPIPFPLTPTHCIPAFNTSSLPPFILHPLQDLFNKFLSLILPEAINYILSEEETTLEMFDTVSSFTLTSYPNMSILQALGLLTDSLRECSLKSAPPNLSTTAAVEELRNKFSSLLASPSRDSKMTPAQVILNSMYGLFQVTELATLNLFEMIENIDIPDDWESVDLIKQTSSLMHSSSNASLADELLFVRKAQAIIEFCMECKSLLRAFKLDIKSSDSELLEI